MIHLETDVLVVGSGGAGMYAANGAARNGADVILADKSMISRGGATIMAQMTTAAALGEQEPDSWQKHLEDTLEAAAPLQRGTVGHPVRGSHRPYPRNGRLEGRLGAKGR